MYDTKTPSHISKSTDAGKTWTALTNTENIRSGGNEAYRWAGSRLIVHPNTNKNNTLYFGTREQGLYTTTDGGNNWEKVQSFPFKNSTSSWQHGMFLYFI